MVLPPRKYRLQLLMLFVALLYFVSNLQKVIIPGSIFNELQSEFHSGAAGIAGVGAAFMYSYALFQLFVGLLADRYCGTRVIMGGGLLLGAGALICGMSSALWHLYTGRILISMGAASIYLSMVKETSRVFPKNFPLMFGIIMLIGYSGGIAGSSPFIAGVQRIGWHWMLIAIGIGTLIVYAGFAGMRSTLRMPSVQQGAKFDFRRFIEAFRNRHNCRLCGTTSLVFAVYFSLQSMIGKKFLEDFFRMTPAQAGGVMSVMMAIAAGNCLLSPILSRLAGNRRKPFMLLIGFGGSACMLGILLALLLDCRSAWIGMAVFWLLAFCANMSPVSTSLYRETNRSDILGVTLSGSNFISYLLTAFFCNCAGLLMDLFPPVEVSGIRIYGRNSYLAVFALLAAGTAFSAWNSLYLRESKGKNIAGEIR